MAFIKLKDMVVTYDDSQETKDAVFDAVMKYFTTHEAFDSETICQSDEPIMDGYVTLADIADNIMKFEVQYDG